jgi:pimeloyl-ACP methyl ester carboxylesterase
MFTPSAVIATWVRGLLSLALIAGAACLFVLWYRELPRRVENVQPLPGQQLNESDPPWPSGALRRISRWRPAVDKATALLAGAVLLSIWSLGAGRLTYPLLRRRGKDEPASNRSDRRSRLQRPDGTELNIEEFGKLDGPAVIMTHGWGMDSTEWYYAKKELAKEHRVIVWDLPGVGLSTKASDNDYSIERFARDLHAVVEWSSASRVVLVGHSIGGMILQTFICLFPRETVVAGIALVHTTYKNPIRTTRNAAFYSAIEKPVIIPLLYATMLFSPLVWLMNVLSYLNGSVHRSTDRQSFSGNETRGQLNFTSRFVLVQSPGVLARGMLGMIHFDESASVKAIGVPTLVVAGEKDPVTLPSASEFLTRSISKARGVSIPTGKHQAQMEMHETFLGELNGFIAGAISRAASLDSQSSPAPLTGPSKASRTRLAQG